MPKVVAEQKTVYQIKTDPHQHNQYRHLFTPGVQPEWKYQTSVEVVESKKRQNKIVSERLNIAAGRHEKVQDNQHHNLHQYPPCPVADERSPVCFDMAAVWSRYKQEHNKDTNANAYPYPV